MSYKKIFCVAVGVIVLCLFFYKLFFYFFPNTYQLASRFIRQKISKHSEVVMYYDDHGGFHGDGTAWIVMKFNESDITEFLNNITTDKRWRKFPLVEEFIDFGLTTIPDVEQYQVDISQMNGYYYFYDTQNRTLWPIEASSHNFVMAAIDVDRNILYIYKFDS